MFPEPKTKSGMWVGRILVPIKRKEGIIYEDGIATTLGIANYIKWFRFPALAPVGS